MASQLQLPGEAATSAPTPPQFYVTEAVIRIEYALGHLQATVDTVKAQLVVLPLHARRITTMETILSYTAAGIGLAVLLYTTLGGV